MTDFNNLEVVDLDPLGVGTLPRYILVESLLGERLYAIWAGDPALTVGDVVRCRVSSEGRYLIVEGTSGSTVGQPPAHTHDYVAAADYEDSDVLSKIKNVDGSGSGLDADLLDGSHLSAIQALDFTKVSALWESDAGAVAWQTDAGGNLSGSTDLFPMGEGLGLFNREVNHWRIPAYHFNDNQSYATPPSPLAWRSGGGFSGAPSVANTTAYRSILELAATNAGNQYFLNTAIGAGLFCEARLWPRGLSGLMVGVRLDDGSDNNYAEAVMQYSAVGVYKLTTRQRTGGGAVTSTDYLAGVLTSEFVDLALALSGSVQYRINTPVLSPFAGVAVGWTPTRQGVVMRGSSATNYTVYIDWFNPI